MHTLRATCETLGGATPVAADNDNEENAWLLISETEIAKLLARALMRGAEYRADGD
jgi:hypothetical protein